MSKIKFPDGEDINIENYSFIFLKLCQKRIE